MHDNRPQDLKMIGTTSSNGGKFGKVRIVGECEILGDVSCERLSCVGETKIKGRMQAGVLKVTGEYVVQGDMQAGSVSGRGELLIEGGMRADDLHFLGDIRTSGDCEMEKMDLAGSFAVGGLLGAERLDIRMYGPCEAVEIGGGTIRIARSRTSLLKNLVVSSKRAAHLRTRLIEGDKVELSYTEADVVRGRQVIIGAGCRIGTIEYSGELRVDRGSTVKERKKV